MQDLDIGITLKLAWEGFTKNAVPLVIGAILVGLLSAFTLGILAGPMMLGYYGMCLKIARGEPVEINNVFDGLQHFGPAFVLCLLLAIGIVVGSIVIIGGLIVVFLAAWAFVIMADGEYDAMAAIRRSAEYNLANIGPVIVFLIVNGVVASIGSAIGGFGALVTGPIANLMLVHGYLRAFRGGALESPLD